MNRGEEAGGSTMKLSDLHHAAGAVRKNKRRGKGAATGLGGTAGRGHKGQKARSGGRIHRWFEGGQMPLQRRLPKRGFKNHGRAEYQVVALERLAGLEPGTVVTKELLAERNLIKSAARPTKLLGDGELAVALTVRLDAASKSAMDKVAQAGGKVELPGAGA
jgi:large subunit ribosomal protein L15